MIEVVEDSVAANQWCQWRMVLTIKICDKLAVSLKPALLHWSSQWQVHLGRLVSHIVDGIAHDASHSRYEFSLQPRGEAASNYVQTGSGRLHWVSHSTLFSLTGHLRGEGGRT